MAYLKGIWAGFNRYRYLLLNLVSRDIKVKYRRSALGVVWSVLNPLLMMLVQYLVFNNLFGMGNAENMQINAISGQPPNFAIYLLSGQLIFSFFSEATNLAMDSVLGSASLIKKVYIPKYIFPLEKVIFSFVNALFSLIALIIVFIFTKSTVSAWLALFWVPMVLLFIFNLGAGLILSALTVFFRDIKHFYGVVLTALNFLTPIFYTESIFMGKSGFIEQYMPLVLRMNPVYWYVSMFRRLVVYSMPPTLSQWIGCIGWAFVALVLGLAIFKKAQDRFILYV
ncbi:ABC transporter permease [Ruminococcaceae bacterium OttesenSCG-928-A16]|nr:ABC transporter permease [Ruminococcaceae bacterium OttesenSCG-928-A16]